MPLLPNAQENAMIQAGFVPGTTYYMSLHTATPGNTGASEVTGGSYARQAIVFTTATAGVESNNATITFSSLPAEAGGIPYFGIWTLVSGGTYLGGGTVTGVPGPMSAGTSLALGAGTVTATQTS
jgi:hypothetical protein